MDEALQHRDVSASVRRHWRRARGRWHLTGLEVRLFAFLWPAGIALFVVGLLGDALGWWVARPYLLELTGSMTGVLVGIPLALVVLRRLENATAEEILVRTTARRTNEAAQRFVAALAESYCREGFPEAHLDSLRAGALTPEDLRELAALHLRTGRVADQVSTAREELTHGDAVHDVMTRLVAELDGGVRPPHPDLVGMGEVMFETVRGYVSLGEAFAVAEEQVRRRALWRDVVVPRKNEILEMRIDWESEHLGEAREKLDRLSSFYVAVAGQLSFAQMVLQSTNRTLATLT